MKWYLVKKEFTARDTGEKIAYIRIEARDVGGHKYQLKAKYSDTYANLTGLTPQAIRDLPPDSEIEIK